LNCCTVPSSDELREACDELLARDGSLARRRAKCSGREARHGVEEEVLAREQGVADAEHPGVEDAQHVARPGLVHGAALLREELLRP
jgi:hypothetical protein